MTIFRMVYAMSKYGLLYRIFEKLLILTILGLQTSHCACPCKYCGPTTMCHNMGLLEVPYTIPTNGVTRVLLYGNLITSLEANQFRGMFRVTEIDLHNNRIKDIHSDAFSDLEYLESLHLSDNRIDHIPSGALLELTRLSRLFLDKNKLKMLPADVPYLSGLQKLNLGGNAITNIPWSSFYALRRLQSIILWNNPLQCNCNTLELTKWFRKSPKAASLISDAAANECTTKVITDVCSSPKVVEVRHIGRKGTFASASSTATYVQSNTAILHCNATGLPAPMIVWKTPSAGYVYPYSSDRMVTHANGTLIIQNLRVADTGEYSCHPQLVDDLNMTSSILHLKIVRGVKPTITDFTEKVQGDEGTRVILRCRATGSPSPVIQWYPPKSLAALQDGNFTQNDTKYVHNKDDATLEIVNLSEEDAGTWRCRASNKMGFDAAYIQVSYSSQENNLFLILIIAACVVVSLIIVVVVTVTCVTTRRKRRKQETQGTEPTEQSDRVVEGENQNEPGVANRTYLPPETQGGNLQQPYTQVPEIKGIRI